MKNYAEINKESIDSWKDKYDPFWMRPISHEEFSKVKDGDFHFRLADCSEAEVKMLLDICKDTLSATRSKQYVTID